MIMKKILFLGLILLTSYVSIGQELTGFIEKKIPTEFNKLALKDTVFIDTASMYDVSGNIMQVAINADGLYYFKSTTSGAITNLSSLNDVDTSGIATNDFLRYNGSGWVVDPKLLFNNSSVLAPTDSTYMLSIGTRYGIDFGASLGLNVGGGVSHNVSIVDASAELDLSVGDHFRLTGDCGGANIVFNNPTMAVNGATRQIVITGWSATNPCIVNTSTPNLHLDSALGNFTIDSTDVIGLRIESIGGTVHIFEEFRKNNTP